MQKLAKKCILLISFCFIFQINIFSQVESEDDFLLEKNIFEEVIDELFIISKETKSYALFETQFGLSFLNYTDSDFTSEFTPCGVLGINYGWSRFTKIDTNISYLGSESVYLLILSSHLKPANINLSGIHLENWQFGFAYKNGWGYNLDKERVLMLYHNSAINFSKFAFEQFGKNELEKEILNNYSKKYKVGSSFESGVLFPISRNFSIDLSYTYNLVFYNFELTKWLGSAGIELIYQRTVDFLAKDIIEKFEKNSPILLFLLKNGFSYIYYTLKCNKEYYPFSSSKPLRIQKLRLGLSFNF